MKLNLKSLNTWGAPAIALLILISLILWTRGWVVERPDVPKDILQAQRLAVAAEHGDTTALATLNSKADQGDRASQFQLGEMYEYGSSGVAKNPAEAMKWHRKAAEQGQAWAQLELGSKYEDGEGVPKDYGEAAKWLRMAAENESVTALAGPSQAQERLSRLYAKGGHGLEKSNVMAFVWSAYPYRYWFYVSITLAALSTVGLSVKQLRSRTLYLLSLLGRIVASCLIILIAALQSQCIRPPLTLWQTFALGSLSLGAIIAILLYWLLSWFMSVENYKKRRCFLLMPMAAILAIGHFVYDLCLNH